MTCTGCGKDRDKGFRFGVMLSSIGITPRVSCLHQTLFYCHECYKHPLSRKARSAFRRLISDSTHTGIAIVEQKANGAMAGR